MNQLRTSENGYQSRIRTGTIQLFCWSAAYVAAAALMKFGPRHLWNPTSVLTPLAIGFNVVIGIGFVLANKTYIANLDELQQKVYFNALGITAGVALVAGVAFSMMDDYRLIPFHADISRLLILMSLTFVASIVYGNWRYR